MGDETEEPTREKLGKSPLNSTFYRFLSSKFIASVSWNLFIVFYMWKVVEMYHSVFLAGSIATIYLAVSLITAIPIGSMIDRINNSHLNFISSIIMGAGFSVFLIGFSIDYVYVATMLISFGITMKGDSFSAIIKKHVLNDSITRATSYNQASVGFSALVGYALGGVSLIFLSEAAPFLLILLTVFSLGLAIPVRESGGQGIAPEEKSSGSYREVLKFYRKITGFFIFALVINGFFVSLDVYGSGIFYIFLDSTPFYYTLFVSAIPVGMIAGSFIANRYSRFLDSPGKISFFLLIYVPALITIGLSKSAILDIIMAGWLGLVMPLVNVQLFARLVRFTPKNIFGKVFAFLRIFIGSSTPIMATVFTFLSLFAAAPEILFVVGLLMLPFSLFSFGVIRNLYRNTESEVASPNTTG